MCRMNQEWEAADGTKPFADLKVRQAVAHAINKQAIVDALYPGTGIAAKNVHAARAVGL